MVCITNSVCAECFFIKPLSLRLKFKNSAIMCRQIARLKVTSTVQYNELQVLQRSLLIFVQPMQYWVQCGVYI